MRLLNRPTPSYVKLYCSQCVKGDYDKMQPIPIGEQSATQTVSILKMGMTFVCANLIRKPVASAVLKKVLKPRTNVGC